MIILTAEEIMRIGAETEREQTLIDFIESMERLDADKNQDSSELADELDKLRDRLERAKDILDE